MKTKSTVIKSYLSIGAGFFLLAMPVLSGADPLDDMVKEQKTTNSGSVSSQKKINRLADQIQTKIDQFKETERERRVLKAYNDRIARLVGQQNDEIASLNRQIDGIEQTSREVTPLMLSMVDGLENFVQLDYPFLLKERTQRVKDLRRIMDLANVADSEKYRLILEAYQIENDYGASIEYYSDTLNVGQSNQPLTVDLLRFGRVALVYQTLDRSQSGFWNNDEKRWETLPESYNLSVREGIMIAQKQGSPDLIKLPLPAPEVAK